MAILDQSGDALGEELYRIASLYGAPDFVKSASREQLTGPPGMPARGFAFGGTMFPIGTPAATWVSTAFFEEKRAAFDPDDAGMIAGRLASAAAYWGIAPECRRLQERVKAAADSGDAALADGDFAFVMQFDNGTKERHCRLRNGREVKAAAAWLERHRDDFVRGDRRTIARKVLAKQAAFDVTLDGDTVEFLERQAGLGTCAAAEARRLVRDRATLLGRRDIKMAADLSAIAAAMTADGVDVRDPAVLEKVAEAVEKADRVAGLDRMYAEGLERPEDVLFAVTAKFASDFLAAHVQLITGSLYKVADLERLRATQVEEVLGSGVADALSSDTIHLDREKLAEILPTLPRGDARLFDQLAEAAGVAPVQKEAAVRRGGLDRGELFALGAALAG